MNNKKQNNEKNKYKTLAFLVTFIILWGLAYWLFIA
ncbi:Uncharacterised protein [Staphylococcus aureus]|uniref:Uncharacterized protein n=1 Tax=Mammaliicoccus stepanovicii TaxID=643214 RepID=A0A239Z855_9STAP|nr:Uncharacterised protein [Staphylococcus aureus]SNV67123.1 Uncharacterised protein [Mammaliicoccus stepanovicii]